MGADRGRLVRRIPKAARGPKAQRRAYAATVYRAGEVEARVGRQSPGLDAMLAGWGVRRGAFLTAWNPWGRRGGERVNAMLQRRLLGETRRLPCAEGECGTADWVERMLFLGAPPARVAALGRRYRQAAVVHAVRGRPLRLAYWPRFHIAPRTLQQRALASLTHPAPTKRPVAGSHGFGVSASTHPAATTCLVAGFNLLGVSASTPPASGPPCA